MHAGFPRLSDVKRLLRRSQELELSTHAVQRLKWFVYALEHHGNISVTCRHFGIARSTFLCWLHRFDAKDPRSLEEHSRRPHTVNRSHTDPHVIALIKMLRIQQPLIGKKEIQKILDTQHGIQLSSSTIGREIARHHFFFGNTKSHRAKRGELRVMEGEREAQLPACPMGETKTSFVLHPLLNLPSFGSRSILSILCIISMLCIHTTVHADATPANLVYEGRLLDTARVPITSQVTMRFSLWKSGDWTVADAVSGSIETAAVNYGGWNEVQNITPDAAGIISLRLGSVTTLPQILLANHQYLQVEVKTVGAADTAYQLIDPTGDAAVDTNDRQFIGAVPYAKVAETLQNRTLGTGSGTIPYLRADGTLPESTLGAGTLNNAFTLDFDNTSTGSITLQFGSTLAKTLVYDTINARFTFNDDVRIQGDLTVTGLINGIDLSALQNAEGTQLKVSSGAGLHVNVAGGNYRLNGDVTNYGGESNLDLTDNTTNYVFFGSGGLTIRTLAFPTDESFIPVAIVTASGGAVSAVTDSRVLQTDDREQTILKTYHASFEQTSYQGDGIDNVGQLSVSHDNIILKNFYVWTSTKATMQDYDILLRVTLPSGFVRWKDGVNPFEATYRSTSAQSTDNRLDLQVYDTNGVPVTLSGSVTSLASTSWATTGVEFTGSPTWTAGQDFLVRLKLSAKDNYQMHLGDLRLQYVQLQ